MSNERIDALAKRALAHLRSASTDQAPDVMALPVDTYLDAERFRREFQAIFLEKPQGLVLTIEVPEPGSFVARTILGKPLLIVRGTDGVVRSFLNVCRHRGAQVCHEGKGTAAKFVCPYHAWTYDRQGALVGMYGKDKFGLADPQNLGLTELACQERAGIIWGTLTVGATFDIDEWLGDFATELETLELAHWHLFDQREIPGPGWKITMDGYLEAYHHDTVHAATLSRHTIGNLLVHDTYGPHQRLVMARRNIGELEELSSEQWNAIEKLRLIHSIFPNMSVSGILGDHCLVSQIRPGKTPSETVTVQTILVAREPRTDVELERTREFSRMAEIAVGGEDYPVGFSIQAGLASGANRHFLIGRNEPAIQHYHRMVSHFMASGRAALPQVS